MAEVKDDGNIFCSGCGQRKNGASFSKTQKKKNQNERRCKECTSQKPMAECGSFILNEDGDVIPQDQQNDHANVESEPVINENVQNQKQQNLAKAERVLGVKIEQNDVNLINDNPDNQDQNQQIEEAKLYPEKVVAEEIESKQDENNPKPDIILNMEESNQALEDMVIASDQKEQIKELPVEISEETQESAQMHENEVLGQNQNDKSEPEQSISQIDISEKHSGSEEVMSDPNVEEEPLEITDIRISDVQIEESQPQNEEESVYKISIQQPIESNDNNNNNGADDDDDDSKHNDGPASTIKLELEDTEPARAMSRLSLSPRVTAIKKKMAAERSFDGQGLPLIVCIRCNNNFLIQREKSHNYFLATARQRNLKFAFGIIPHATLDDTYQIIHVNSSCYVTVKQIQNNFILYPVAQDRIHEYEPKDLNFEIIKISEDGDVNLRVTIKWKNKFLTLIEIASQWNSPRSSQRVSNIVNGDLPSIAENWNALNDQNGTDDEEEDFKVSEEQRSRQSLSIRNGLPPMIQSQVSHLDGTDKVLLFKEAYTENIDAQIFTFQNLTDELDDDELDIMFLLDLVDEPRPSKIGKLPYFEKYKHIDKDLNKLVQDIWLRLDIRTNGQRTGYAVYSEVWKQFMQYSDGMVSRIVLNTFEQAVGVMDNNSSDSDLSGGTGDLSENLRKLIHIKNFIAAIDTITEFKESEIKQEALEKEAYATLRKGDPIALKLRRLDSDILSEHPFLKQWQEMSPFRRKLYDWQCWLNHKWSSSSNVGSFLWRKHLVEIQGNFGQSIFAFFEFTRWLMMLNVIMSAFYMILIAGHAYNFHFGAYSVGKYVNMALGNEFIDSWWFYGAYQAEYENSVGYNVGFMWIVACVAAALVSIIAILRVLLSKRGEGDDGEYVFSFNVFSNYSHSLTHPDDIRLQETSLMITLHETLLQRLDAEARKLTCVLFFKRVIGVCLCLFIGGVSAVGITVLIYYEKDAIIPFAKGIHPVAEKGAPFIVPAGVAVIKAITPKMVRKIVLFESYSAEFLFQQEFFRVFLLRIFAILVTLFQTAQTAEETELEDGEACAESQIGMVLYKFIFFDMCLEIFFYFILPTIVLCCSRCCGFRKRMSKEEELMELERKRSKALDLSKRSTEFELAGDSWKAPFDISGALVDIMYRQGIVWSGMYFSPMIPVLAIIASVITFFVKKRYLFKYCARPKKALGVTKQLKFFYGMMLIAIIVSFVPLNYFLSRTPTCGPHSDQHILSETETTLDEDMPLFLKTFFSYAFNGLLLLPLFLLTLIYLGYVSGVRKVHAANSRHLKAKLIKEKEEKKQILKDYSIRL